MLDRQEVRELYDAGAGHYHRTTLLYRLVGLRMQAYRMQAVDALALSRADASSNSDVVRE